MRPKTLILGLVFSTAFGCARDLLEVSDTSGEPTFLGELAGRYNLTLEVP